VARLPLIIGGVSVLDALLEGSVAGEARGPDGEWIGSGAKHLEGHGGFKVGAMVDWAEKDPAAFASKVIATDRAGNVLDGHHRWAAGAIHGVGHPSFTVPTLRADTDIHTLMKHAHAFDDVRGIPRRAFGHVREALDPRKAMLASDCDDGVPRKLSYLPRPVSAKAKVREGVGWLLEGRS
jgi:hypothetical protein